MNNKITKHRNENIGIKSTRTLTIKNGDNLTSRTPKNNNNGKKIQTKKERTMHKFKSIPSIPYKYMEISSMPTEHLNCQSYTVYPI
jgi:hypothetical protein